VPVVAIIDGIRVLTFPHDHDPPHFQAFLAEHRIKVDIHACAVIGPRGPLAMERKLLAWTAEHTTELLAAWSAVRAGRKPERIR